LTPTPSDEIYRVFIVAVEKVRGCFYCSLSAETPSGRLGGRAPVLGGASDRDVLEVEVLGYGVKSKS